MCILCVALTMCEVKLLTMRFFSRCNEPLVAQKSLQTLLEYPQVPTHMNSFEGSVSWHQVSLKRTM